MTGRTARALKKAKSEEALAARRTKFTNIVIAQEGKCWFCGEKMGVDCTKEHLLAQTFGGTDTKPEGNLVAAHAECNQAVGHLPVSDKYRLRDVCMNDGKEAFLALAKQLRRADTRLAFEGRELGPKYWAKMGLTEKPDWWDG